MKAEEEVKKLRNRVTELESLVKSGEGGGGEDEGGEP